MNLIQQVEAGNKKSKPAQVAKDFAKTLRAKQKNRSGRYSRGLTKNEEFD
jgi:hypothetical protein